MTVKGGQILDHRGGAKVSHSDLSVQHGCQL